MDYYQADKNRLNGQPKRTIADYVEKNGILVPTRFDSLKEAINSKRDILFRSEHSQEYDGISGMLESFSYTDNQYMPKGAKDLEEVKERYFHWSENDNPPYVVGTPMYKQWAGATGQDLSKVKRDITFSIWEKLPGLNRKVIADDSVPNRWYVMTEGRFSEKRYVANTVIFQNGEIVEEFGMSNQYPELRRMPDEIRSKIPSLIEIYETIRNLPNFDPNHCPEMEFQYHDGKDYFLQYHKVRDFKEREFILDRAPTQDEIMLPFVRGSTGEFGEVCDTTVYYAKDSELNTIYDASKEDGSWDFHYNHIFSENESRKRKLQMEECRDNDYQWKIRAVCGNHDSFSKMFKPQVSALIDIRDLLLPGENIDHFFGKEYQKNQDNSRNRSSMKLKVTSDGEKGYIERI